MAFGSMKTVFDQCDCQNLKNALAKEWLETNGLGGFASSTIIGANTRRQHGLLVASLHPPVERHVLLSKFEERVVIDGHESAISTNLYPGTVFPARVQHPDGVSAASVADVSVREPRF